jgi:hypothetical protein
LLYILTELTLLIYLLYILTELTLLIYLLYILTELTLLIYLLYILTELLYYYPNMIDKQIDNVVNNVYKLTTYLFVM